MTHTSSKDTDIEPADQSCREGALNTVLQKRRAGVILHPTSLPGPGVQGSLGVHAFRFIDFLAECGYSVWQVLPLGPPHDDGSPYQTQSLYAGNTSMISVQELCNDGFIDQPSADQAGAAGDQHALYHCLSHARRGFTDDSNHALFDDYQTFVSDNTTWLSDYVLFKALKGAHQGKPWWQWPAPLRDRQAAVVNDAAKQLAEHIEVERFAQFVFHRQWQAVRDYANSRGVLLFGDMPIFVAADSAEVWAQRQQFKISEIGELQVVAGVPPDAFSETGQRWGNPHYHWQRMAEDGFQWWHRRIRAEFRRCDLLRIDHFRGFCAAWEIPGHAKTAVNGEWVKAPGAALFAALNKHLGELPLVAEDLGVITDDVVVLRKRCGFPGMKVLQFAFDKNPHNPYLPHNHERNSVVYSGTHDNDTTLGWLASLDATTRGHVKRYLGADDLTSMMRATYMSHSQLAMLPLQDVLGLDSAHRLNTPGTQHGNWRWRFCWQHLHDSLSREVRHSLAMYDRIPSA